MCRKAAARLALSYLLLSWPACTHRNGSISTAQYVSSVISHSDLNV